MKKFLFNPNPIFKDAGLLTLRLFIGTTMMLSHGWMKLEKLLNGDFEFANVMGMGEPTSLVLTVFAEVFCAMLLALGLMTRLALIPLIITMLVAVFIIHGNDPFSKQEFGLLYLIPFITLLLTGPGKFSLDAYFSKK